MTPRILSRLVLISICVTTQSARAQSGGLFDWLGLRFVDRTGIRVRDLVTDPPIVRESEARHLQIGWIADRHPRNFATRVDGRPHIYADGPSLGKLNFWSAFGFDRAGDGTIDEVNASDVITTSNDRLSISAYQLINDIPISGNRSAR